MSESTEKNDENKCHSDGIREIKKERWNLLISKYS